MKLIMSLVLVLVGVASLATASDEVTVRLIDEARFELLLRSSSVLDPSTAQQRLLIPAKEACNGLNPVFEMYQFESLEPLGEADEVPESVFRQVVRCSSGESPATAGVPNYVELSVPPDAQVKEEIFARTVEFFRNKAEGDPQAAFENLSDFLKDSSRLLETNAKYRNELGTVESLDVPRVTIYHDPPGAPKPGLYVAADYFNRYSKIPIQCGYLVWYQIGAGKFEIVREETGTIPPEVLNQVSEQELAGLLSQMRCVSR